jgi:hypothetical protein
MMIEVGLIGKEDRASFDLDIEVDLAERNLEKALGFLMDIFGDLLSVYTKEVSPDEAWELFMDYAPEEFDRMLEAGLSLWIASNPKFAFLTGKWRARKMPPELRTYIGDIISRSGTLDDALGQLEWKFTTFVHHDDPDEVEHYIRQGIKKLIKRKIIPAERL